ncbi:hypothetical protein [Flavobacterium frigoris]|uniref:Lipoprotein n=1 Tax=Flavobacterium frigoris (strain PS1) TaxID=1086011 RepID=H7FSZ4_FLAFP|nr:hypothetical protein [Flavobacterium frigoris]EIA08691.1 hypothetical protein HJ01_02413 [Flavobacterium frigoris PS1]
MKKIFCLFIYILSISCTTNSSKFQQISDSKIIENITTLNVKVAEPNKFELELKEVELANWNSNGFFNKYKYWFLILVVYIIVGFILDSTIKDDLFDNRKIKKAYLFYIFSSLLGGHFIYLGKGWKYLFYSILLLTFLFINTFIISHFYNNPTVLIYTISENLTSKIILCLILIMLTIDFLTLSIQVFKVNKSFRDTISPKNSKERQLCFIDIKTTLEKNNNLMLQKYNQWKK